MLLGFAGLVALINTARHYHRERKGYKLHKQFLADSANKYGADNGGGGVSDGVTRDTAAAPAGVVGDMERGDMGVEQAPYKNPLTAAREVSGNGVRIGGMIEEKAYSRVVAGVGAR